jgi:hypothetical protein
MYPINNAVLDTCSLNLYPLIYVLLVKFHVNICDWNPPAMEKGVSNESKLETLAE